MIMSLFLKQFNTILFKSDGCVFQNWNINSGMWTLYRWIR